MTSKNTYDPAEFVDEFSKVVAQWSSERKQWEESITTHGGNSTWGRHSTFKAKVLGDLDRMFKMQDKVNVMMLAALDELRSDD